MTKLVSFHDFKIINYVAKTYISGARKFDFKEERVENLPFIESGHIIDLKDSYINYTGCNLILRLGKSKKTFYVKTPNCSMKKLGVWKKRSNSRHYEKGTLSIARARELAVKHIESVLNNALDDTAISNMTIKEYLETGQYEIDRNKIKLKSNKIKPLRKEIIKVILHGARRILEYKICDIHVSWIDILKEDWDSTYNHKTINKPVTKTLDSQRRYFTVINAMFNLWDRAGYIRKNPMGEFVSDFYDPAKKAGKRMVNTINEVSTKEAADFVIEKLPENTAKLMHGKIVLATMVLTGCRNCEVFRNYSHNWDFQNRQMTIPGEIIGKTSDTRTIPIEHDSYWEMMKRYFNMPYPYFYKTKKEFLLPNDNTSTGHATDNCIREQWKKFKFNFNIPQKKRAYDFRHTFANNLRKQGHDVAAVAYYLGDDPETVATYYFTKDPEIARSAIKSLHSNERENKSIIDNSSSFNKTASNALVEVHEKHMPAPIRHIFDMYKSGRIFDGKMTVVDFAKFISLASAMKDKLVDEESKLWITLQAA